LFQHISIRDIRNAKQRESSIKPYPEYDVPQELVPLDGRCTTGGDQRYLNELQQEKVHPIERENEMSRVPIGWT
jgi:hypothetical protein